MTITNGRPDVGLLGFLRGDDLLEQRSGNNGESRSLPAAENQLPLMGGYTASPITPTKALAPPFACWPTPPRACRCTSTARPATAATSVVGWR